MDVFTVHVNVDENLEYVWKNISNAFYEECVKNCVGAVSQA